MRLLVNNLAVPDAVHIVAGLFALSMVLSWFGDVHGRIITDEIQQITLAFGLPPLLWLWFLIGYTVASFSCLVWKNSLVQSIISFVGMFWWTTAGVATLLAPTQAAAGIFELQLGVLLLIILYYRGASGQWTRKPSV